VFGIQGMDNVVAFSESAKRACLTSENMNRPNNKGLLKIVTDSLSGA